MPRSTSKMIAKIIQPYRRLGARGARGAVNTGGGVTGRGGGGGLTGGTFSSINAEATARHPMRQAVNRNRWNAKAQRGKGRRAFERAPEWSGVTLATKPSHDGGAHKK